MNTYYNTTDLFGNELAKCTAKAITQDAAVYEILKEAKTHLTTPEIHAIYTTIHKGKLNTPLTSIRRSCSTLKKKGLLELVEVKKQGIFGRPNKQYRVITTK